MCLHIHVLYMYIHVHVYTVHVLYNVLVHVDDDYDEYGRSLEEDEPLSPHTAGETVQCMSVVLTLHSYDDLL